MNKIAQAKSEGVEKARCIQRDMLGQMTVQPQGDVLVASPTINAAGLVRSAAAMNRSFVVAGAGLGNNLRKTIHLLTIPKP